MRPPKDITPAQFFEEWLPGQVPAGAASAPIGIRYHLDGEGGGAWHLAITPEGLTTIPANGPADVGVRQTVADWRAITVGEDGATNLAPEKGSPTDLLFLDRTAQQIVRQTTGSVRFEVTGYNGRTWALIARLGPGAEDVPAEAADATISVDAETYAGILARTIPPPQAFFSGKVKLTGNVNLAMQLGMALMPRFG